MSYCYYMNMLNRNEIFKKSKNMIDCNFSRNFHGTIFFKHTLNSCPICDDYRMHNFCKRLMCLDVHNYGQNLIFLQK